MTQPPTLLDPLAFRLRGRSLIEASAGTGKTFTIAALYLRLVLGHGGGDAFPAPLTPPQILVVTFTEAATKELRDRIRARLAQAAQLFLLDPATPPAAGTEPLLLQLRASYPPGEWAACGQRLRVAAEWMDEAAVSTIHGWCNRMLREHAFDSGSLFHQDLLADATELQEDAVRDYWRKFFYELDPADAACVSAWWKEPIALLDALLGLLPHAAQLPETPAPAEVLRQVRQECDAELAAMREPWTDWCEELQDLFDEAREQGRLDGKKLQKGWYDGWLAQLRAWCRGEIERPQLSDTALKRLTVDGIRDAWKPPEKAPSHPALMDLETLGDRLGCLPEGRQRVLSHAARWVAQRIAQDKQRLAQVGFDDMLTQLHDALHGPNGARLAELIRAQFPVALIDEFQDTDPVQYGIFRAVYGSDTQAQDTALVLIGDPKQAIYAFRGADIYTYLAARRDTAGRHETLGTNFRSTQAMVEAANHVFLQAEQRAGAGAFLFRSPGEDPLPFVPVQARGRDDQWVVQGQPQAALTCWWHDPAKLGQGEYQRVMAQACASEIVRLLGLAQAGAAGFRQKDGKLRPLEPRDVAVLVNGKSEAGTVREALSALGVRSVYLSDQGNVYESNAAAELQRLLQACASPADGRLVRAALGTPLLALDWQALDRLNHDELHWERTLERFRDYHARWRKQGVLPMLRRLLHDYRVPERLIAQRDERQLTNLLHLAELLQEASTLLDGEHALVRFLAEQRQAPAGGSEQRQLRLESDADLLKVVTVHKSKGLEYPLVFVPFPCNCWPVDPQQLPLRWHDAEGKLHVSLEPDDAMLAAADHGRLGEDLRKLYVALTRARYATWIGLAPNKHLPESAIGYLLNGGQALAPGQLEPLLKATLGTSKHVAVAQAPAAGMLPYTPQQAEAALAAPRQARTPRERWWIASYSRLRGKLGAQLPAEELPAPESAAEETYAESGAADDTGEAAVAANRGTLHAFPAGASDGTFLHGLLEWAGRKGFAAAAADRDELAQQVARRTQPQRWQPHRQAVQDWLGAWLTAPLDLSPLDPSARPVTPGELSAVQVEMEFWLGAAEVDVTALDTIVCRYTLGGVKRPPLAREQVNGMLKGFIDLVFAHQGRYYVADYKSNRLGPDDKAYSSAAMRDAVLHHRYDLQYALYLFALHRLLRARLGEAYRYEEHVGGAVYVFLRGHAAPSGGLHLEKPGKALMDELDALFGAKVAA